MLPRVLRTVKAALPTLVGTALLLALAGFVAARLWSDLRLDLFGVRGYGWVTAARFRQGSAGNEHRTHCTLWLVLPDERREVRPTQPPPDALVKGARETKVSWRSDGEEDDCHALTHSWVEVVFEPDHRDNARRGSEPGFLVSVLGLGLLAAALVGVRRWRQRRPE